MPQDANALARGAPDISLPVPMFHEAIAGQEGRVGRSLRVLALASYPVEAAATRQRICQFIAPLARREIHVDIRPFLSSEQFRSLYERRQLAKTTIGIAAASLRRAFDMSAARSADVIMVQREAMLLGPPICEFLLARLLKKPMVLDLDDATYVAYDSPIYGRLTTFLKCFGKTNDLIRWSRVVICGNRAIAAHAAALGAPTVIIPTIVDTDRFRPAPRSDRGGLPVLGWVGSHSTFPYLQSIFPALEQLAQTVPFRLLVVGSGQNQIDLTGVNVECRPWALEREVADFHEMDVGLYPIVAGAWSQGKSGFKAIQYMAAGLPYVVSPVGSCAEIGEPGVTHIAATTSEDWQGALASLLRAPLIRGRMGEAGRRHAIAHYSLASQVDKLAQTLRRAADSRDLGHSRGETLGSHPAFSS